jgi:hypothetical protein
MITSCSQRSDSKSNATILESNSHKEIEEVIEEVDTHRWIDTIIQNSQPRVKEFQCAYETSNLLKAIDTTFLKKHLIGFKTDFPGEHFEMEFNPYARYYYFDYQEFDSFVSFTILYDTEYGYDNYYTYTFDLKSNSVTTVSCIAQRGADGGAIEEEHLSFSESGKELTVYTQSYFDEDLFTENEFDGCYSRSFDSIISRFTFYPTKTIYSMDTVWSSMDTICN